MALSHLLDTTPPSLLTTAARGGLRPAPDCRPRRALLHLSYSSAPSYSDGAFVTHAPDGIAAGRRRALAAFAADSGDDRNDRRCRFRRHEARRRAHQHG